LSFTWDTIFRLKRKGENVRVDFKAKEFVENKAKVAEHLVAFANRYVGTILIGVKDDPKYQEEEAIIGKIENPDELVLQISQIARTRCSPPITFSYEFLSGEHGDVLIIKIDKRAEMPHAVVKRDGSGEIRSRTYYLRRESGKSLVDDMTLNYLFNERDEPNFKSSITMAIPYTFEHLQIPEPILFRRSSLFIDNFEWISEFFFNRFTEDDISSLKGCEGERPPYYEILPYYVLRLLASFGAPWATETKQIGPSFSATPIDKMESEKYTIEKIPSIPADSIWNELSINSKEIVFRPHIGPSIMRLPKGTKIEIDCIRNPIAESKLVLKRPHSFTFTFSFRPSIWMRYLPQEIVPLFHRWGIKVAEGKIGPYCIQYHEVGMSYLFAFPEEDDLLFRSVHSWAKRIESAVKRYLSWEKLIQNIQDMKKLWQEQDLMVMKNDIKKIKERLGIQD